MRPETKKSGKVGMGIIAAAVAGVLIAAGAFIVLTSSPPEAPIERTFTVVAYHWGFAFFDESGEEIEKIEVERGTEVTIEVVTPSHEEHHEYTNRTIEKWEGDPTYGDLGHEEIHELIEESHANGFEDHAIMVGGYEVYVETDGHHDPGSVTFTADEAGAFDILCGLFCGYGHQYMTIGGGFVVT